MKKERIKLLISLFLLLAITVSDININTKLPLNITEVSASEKNVYTYTPEKYPYTQYLDDDVYVYKINLKTGRLTKVKKLLIGTKVKVIGLASSKKKTFCKIKTTDGKLYFIDTTSNPYASQISRIFFAAVSRSSLFHFGTFFPSAESIPRIIF